VITIAPFLLRAFSPEYVLVRIYPGLHPGLRDFGPSARIALFGLFRYFQFLASKRSFFTNFTYPFLPLLLVSSMLQTHTNRIQNLELAFKSEKKQLFKKHTFSYY
jgi:hypothetical protein